MTNQMDVIGFLKTEQSWEQCNLKISHSVPMNLVFDHILEVAHKLYFNREHMNPYMSQRPKRIRKSQFGFDSIRLNRIESNRIIE
jgi:hypothetical protein